METLVMDRKVVWDATKIKQIDEAKKTILKYRRAGYPVRKSDGTLMERFHPNLEEVTIIAEPIPRKKNVLKLLTENGDDRIVWDKDNGREAMQAKKKFEEFLKKGYKAFSVDEQGNRSRKITEFDVDAEEILMTPPTSKG